ncbi:MAG: NAD(P)/FAD-dependent oxidoreductase [Bacteroidales bacterium]|nr:NAD(P)/FAD-dependent oxidoreductase [Bacteroidales bacterium]
MDKRVVIIGSGLGGLACGYILAKHGYNVSIFEKNGQLGGCLQTFRRAKVKFETGMHYIGSMDEGQVLWQFFRYLGLLPDVKLSALDSAAYDIISIAGKWYGYANGYEQFIDSMSQHFPAERAALTRYWATIREVAENSPLYSFRLPDSVTVLNPDFVKTCASDFFDSVTTNPRLRQVLAGNLPLYAGVRGKTPLYIPAFINDFYNKSAYRIVGGSDCIVRSLCRSITEMGGNIRSKSCVTRIKCANGKAHSIKLHTGEEIAADYVISGLHPARTVGLIEPQNQLRKIDRNRILGLENTISNFTVYIRFKNDVEPYFNSNLYHYNRPDVWEGGNYNPDTWPDSFLYMHLCSKEEQKYADGAVLISYMNYEEVAQWENRPQGNRGDDYNAFKRRKAEKLLEELEKQMPGTKANISRYYTSTPLTYADYTGTEKGAMYGILRDCNKPLQIIVSQRTKIQNLYQTGQNINSHGILGVLVGALITSGELLDLSALIREMKALM